MNPSGKARRLSIVTAVLLALAAQDAWATVKLTLNPSQVTLDGATSSGDPGRLVDEQALAGDPRAGDRVDLTSTWTSTSGTHVNAAILDLGASYQIKRIYLYDRNGSGSGTQRYTVATGSPTSGWSSPIISDPLDRYQVWRGFPNDTSNDGTGFVDDPALEFSGVTTRYLRLVDPTGFLAMPEIVVYADSVTTSGDVAAGKSTVASSTFDGTTPAANAVDSSTTTEWRSNSGAKPYTYLEVDLGGYYSISRFDLQLGTATGSAPADFEIQAQNQGCWQTVPGTAVTGNPATNVSLSLPVSPALVTNKVRFVCPAGGSGCRVRKLAAIGTASTASAAAPPSCDDGTQVMRRAPSYDYAQFLPVTYNDDPAETFPLVIALHGIKGETLTSTRTGVHASPEGLARQLTSTATLRATFPAIAVSPHCNAVNVADNTDCAFNLARLRELWNDVMSTYRVDPDRVYVTGLSAGGIEAIRFAMSYHEDLAALLPIAFNLSNFPRTFDATTGAPVPDANGNHMCDMQQLPIFAVHGTIDSDSRTRPVHTLNLQQTMNVQCNPDHPKTIIRLIIGGTHSGNTWNTAYQDSRTWDWVFAQRASDKDLPATHQAPAVTVSANQTVTLPANTATFTGSATDSDGTVSKLTWVDATNLSGTWPLEIDNSSSVTVSRTTAGTYRFRLIATDDDGFTGFNTVTFTVKPQP